MDLRYFWFSIGKLAPTHDSPPPLSHADVVAAGCLRGRTQNKVFALSVSQLRADFHRCHGISSRQVVFVKTIHTNCGKSPLETQHSHLGGTHQRQFHGRRSTIRTHLIRLNQDHLYSRTTSSKRKCFRFNWAPSNRRSGHHDVLQEHRRMAVNLWPYRHSQTIALTKTSR